MTNVHVWDMKSSFC